MTLALHETASALIQTSLAPVFLLSVIATTLTVIDTRQNRIVDRARALEAHLRAKTASLEELEEEIDFYVRRARQIGWAAAACTLSGLGVALAVVMLFVDAQITLPLTPGVEAVFTIAVMLYVVSLVIYLRDVFMVTRGITFVRERLIVTGRRQND
ncbi:MAG: DUF2721 domain-containing protein [Rhodobacter sp.]|nr:DUF2721 domain-containing protein [Rhodobacter sp.]